MLIQKPPFVLGIMTQKAQTGRIQMNLNSNIKVQVLLAKEELSSILKGIYIDL